MENSGCPSNGDILRLVVMAEIEAGNPLTKAASVVEYSSIAMGERAAFVRHEASPCPRRHRYRRRKESIRWGTVWARRRHF